MKPLTPHHPFQLALGLSIWAVFFIVIYGGLSLGCRFAPPPIATGSINWLNGTLFAATLLTTALLVFLGLACWRVPLSSSDPRHGPRSMIARVAAGLHWLAAIATLSIGLTVIFLPPCI